MILFSAGEYIHWLHLVSCFEYTTRAFSSKYTYNECSIRDYPVEIISKKQQLHFKHIIQSVRWAYHQTQYAVYVSMEYESKYLNKSI